MYVREQINGNSPQDVMKMNDNFMSIFEKVFGNINYSDIDKILKTKVNTQWIPIQGEGNLDSKYDLLIRFYIPPNVEKVKGSSFNLILENYRMDSTVTKSNDRTVGVPISMSVGDVYGGGVSSTPSVTSTSTTNYGQIVLDIVTGFAIAENGGTGRHFHEVSAISGLGANEDLTVKQTPHSHDITHTHTFSTPPHSHEGVGSVTIEGHSHELQAGIYVHTEQPSNVKIYINDVYVSNLTQSGITCQDLTQNINIGQWNVIKITTDNYARVSLYGTVEVIIK